MWNRIFAAAILIVLAPMAFLTYYANSWLNSIGSPQAALTGFTTYAGFAWAFLWVSSILLLVLGNVVLWKTRKAWAMWTTLLYFSIFVGIMYFVLGPAYSSFREVNGVSNGGFSAGPFLAVLLIGISAAIVFFDQFLVLRLCEKVHPTEIAVSTQVES
ncbi:MAG: hypothetical protein WBD22_13010 [Pyrinomonadaceae bacterium]